MRDMPNGCIIVSEVSRHSVSASVVSRIFYIAALILNKNQVDLTFAVKGNTFVTALI